MSAHLSDGSTLPEGFELIGILRPSSAVSVYRAVSAEYGEVVLKCWNAPLRTDEGRRAFSREAELHAAVSPDRAPHPQIVPFVAASAPDVDHPWIASRAAGVDLATVLSTRTLEETEAFRLARDVLGGLAALHHRSLTHGDVTPANVLVQNGRASLCDLGLASRRSHPRDGGAIGTPEYMAPELRQDPARPCSTRSDVYSAGRVLEEILGGSLLTTRLEHLLVDRAQSHRPTDRPRDAADLARLFDQAVSSRRASTATRGRRASRWRVGVVAAIPFVLAPLVAWLLLRPAPFRMESPVDGDERSSPYVVSGVGAQATGDTAIWIIVSAEGRTPELLTDPATIRSDGSWFRHVDVGLGPCDEGTWFEIRAVALPDQDALGRRAARAAEAGVAFIDVASLPASSDVLGPARVRMTTFYGAHNRCPGTTSSVESVPMPQGSVP